MRRFVQPTVTLPTRRDLSAAELDYSVRPDLMPVFVAQATTLTPDIVRATTVPRFNQANNAFAEQLERFLVRGQGIDETLRAMNQAATEAVQA